ncbi:MAG: hypothetical protein HYT77_10555 [Deltaproteobacteria bacterium]|nr:hypothetical protein [Deltaproteobacteria bacterium]
MIADNIKEHCCDTPSIKAVKDKKPVQKADPRIRTITTTDCLGDHYVIQCIDTTGSPTNPTGTATKRSDITGERPDPSERSTQCRQYEEEYRKNKCREEIQCPDTPAGGTVVALPPCEDLQGFWRPTDPHQNQPSHHQQPTPPNCPQFKDPEISVSFEPSSSDVAYPFDEDDDPDNVYTDDVPGILTEIPEEDRHQIVPVMRLEVPANSSRYWIARSAFRSALSELPSTATNEMGDAYECDEQDLSCEIRPLRILDLREVVRDALGETIDTDVEYDGLRAFHIEGLRYDGGWIKVRWYGDLTATSEEEWGFDLKEETRLNYLPTHSPVHDYTTTTEKSPLPYTELIADIPSSVCDDAEGMPENGLYYSYKKPFFGACNSSSDRTQNYHLMDEVVRPIDPLPLETVLQESESAGASALSTPLRCHNDPFVSNDPLIAVDVAPENIALVVPVSAITTGLSEAESTAFQDKVSRFGCTGHDFVFRNDLPGLWAPPSSGTIPFASSSWRFEQYIVSAAGVDFATKLNLGKFNLNLRAGTLTVEFRILVEISEWLRQRWWGWLIGWIVRWVEIIISGLVTVIANQLNILLLWTLPSDYEVDLDNMTANIHGALRQIQPYETADSEVELNGVGIGVRRLITSTPSVEEPSIGYSWSFDGCSDAFEAFGDFRLVEGLREFFGGCVLEQAENVVRFATAPIVMTFIELGDWLFDLGDEIAEAINKTVIDEADNIQNENDLAGLLNKTVKNFYYESQYLSEEEIETSDSSLAVNRLPFPYHQLCSLAGPSSGACDATELLAGGPLKPSFRITRIGAKTHYRSYDDFTTYLEAGGLFDFNFPPVRFCQAGDNPPATGLLSQGEIDLYTSFDEIKTEEGENWKNQCAYFLDTTVDGCMLMRAPDPLSSILFSMAVAPTVQTVFLINEVFFCPDSPRCNIQLPYIKKRAKAAICSALADVWFRYSASSEGLLEEESHNLLTALTGDNPTERELAAQALKQAGVPVAARIRILGFANSCLEPFEEAGGTIPDQLDENPCGEGGSTGEI